MLRPIGCAVPHSKAVAAVVAARQGAVVKGTGDGTIAIFSAAAEALDAAIEIQQRSIAGREAEEAPTIRVGLAASDVTIEDEDCFGRPVIEACRLEDPKVRWAPSTIESGG
ncbi:MAG: hypothetical protein ACR2N6_00180 [Miltoncostaeaceae bacterium]